MCCSLRYKPVSCQQRPQMRDITRDSGQPPDRSSYSFNASFSIRARTDIDSYATIAASTPSFIRTINIYGITKFQTESIQSFFHFQDKSFMVTVAHIKVSRKYAQCIHVYYLLLRSSHDHSVR